MHFVKPGKLTGCFQNGKEKKGFMGCEGQQWLQVCERRHFEDATHNVKFKISHISVKPLLKLVEFSEINLHLVTIVRTDQPLKLYKNS